jgi:hypothetical protein
MISYFFLSISDLDFQSPSNLTKKNDFNAWTTLFSFYSRALFTMSSVTLWS